MKLVVHVLDASNLMPKDGQGSSSTFVEVEFDQQLHRTRTVPKELNPVWNEVFAFNVFEPVGLPNRTIGIGVYHDRGAGHPRNCLGRVKISGVSVPLSEVESGIQRYPLHKRGLFSHIRGDIALKIYAAMDDSSAAPSVVPPKVLEEPKANEEGNSSKKSKKKKKKKKKKEEEEDHPELAADAQPRYSVRTETLPFGSEFDPSRPMEEEETSAMVQVQRHRYAMAADPEKSVDPMEGGSRFRPNRFGLVDFMEFLFVKVEKARGLPAMDITGSIDPYVEVKVGNYKGVTNCIEKNQNPVWGQVFCFSKERAHANRVEVVIKDRDLVRDDWVGRVVIEMDEVPWRVQPGGPLAPSWYRLEDMDGEKLDNGDIMLAVWMGTQADHYFSETLHCDVHDLKPETVVHTRSGIYHSPKMYYLRVHVIEAQDLVITDNERVPDTCVRIELGANQVKYTRPSPNRSHNPVWNEELMFVAADPLSEQFFIITVEELVGQNKRDPLGQTTLLISEHATFRPESDRIQPVDPRWFNLYPSDKESPPTRDPKFSSKIHLRLCLEGGYHVLDESSHCSSDVQPSTRHLWKPAIGVLEVGILGANNLPPLGKDSRTTDAYIVAKYGTKWIRTRTHLDSQNPLWHEQYTWEVYDPCTVITFAVFNNCQIHGQGLDDRPLGRVQIRLSTLESGRVYNQSHRLVMFGPSGVKPSGSLRVSIRFTCTSWVNMLTLYSQPLLPKMHYVKPIPVVRVHILRQHAVQIVASRLARAEPPLRRETVAYVLDVDHHMWSLRRSRAHFDRIRWVLSGSTTLVQFWGDIRSWRNPITTGLAHSLFLILVCYPELILSTIFMYLFVLGLSNYRVRHRGPPRSSYPNIPSGLWSHHDELDEEFDALPSSRPDEVVRARYDRLRSMAGRAQRVVGDLAMQVERVHGLIGWRDPRATGIFVWFALTMAFVMYLMSFRVMALLGGFYLMRHPRFRNGRMPSIPANFFKRLPAKTDMLL